MSTYVNMQDGPEQVALIGIQLKSLATDFGEATSAILNEIKSIEGGEPWGHDQAGQAFADSYHQVPQGGGTAFSQSLHDELTDAGGPLGKIGGSILNAVASFQLTDVDNSDDITNV